MEIGWCLWVPEGWTMVMLWICLYQCYSASVLDEKLLHQGYTYESTPWYGNKETHQQFLYMSRLIQPCSRVYEMRKSSTVQRHHDEGLLEVFLQVG